MLGGHLLKSWSSTQSLVSLSSAEAEYYGVVKAAATGLGYQALLQDLGVTLPLRVWTDSSASIGICGRQGLGKVRHLATQTLWIQQRVRDGSFELWKVKGAENPADLFTTHLTSRERVQGLLRLFGCVFRGGRPDAAPALRATGGTTKGELLQLSASELADSLPEGHRVNWHGTMFPRDGQGEDREAPDAYECSPGLLPHEHEDAAQRFPRAYVCKELDEKDPPENLGLEKRGVQIGSQAAKKHDEIHGLQARRRASAEMPC